MLATFRTFNHIFTERVMIYVLEIYVRFRTNVWSDVPSRVWSCFLHSLMMVWQYNFKQMLFLLAQLT